MEQVLSSGSTKSERCMLGGGALMYVLFRRGAQHLTRTSLLGQPDQQILRTGLTRVKAVELTGSCSLEQAQPIIALNCATPTPWNQSGAS